MNPARHKLWVVLSGAFLLSCSLRAATLYEATSAYHHIRVVDGGGLRTLFFNDAEETRMSSQNPLLGHFEYTE